jgi:hypothetical protein
MKGGNANKNKNEKDSSLPIDEIKKLNIKDNSNIPQSNTQTQNQNQANNKPAEKTGGLKDLLSNNTNSNNTNSNTKERPRTTRGGRK